MVLLLFLQLITYLREPSVLCSGGLVSGYTGAPAFVQLPIKTDVSDLFTYLLP